MKYILNFFIKYYKKILNLIFKNKKGRFFTMGAMPAHLVLGELENVVDNNRALVLRNENLNMKHCDAIEDFCNKLSNEQDSFDTLFPNYDPNTPILPVKIFKHISGFIEDKFSDVLSTSITKAVKSGGFDMFISDGLKRDTFLNLNSSNREVIINAVKENAGIIHKPLGSFGDITLNETINNLMGEYLGEYLTYSHVLVGSAQLISVGVLFKIIINSYANQVYPLSVLNDNSLDQNFKKDWILKRSKNMKIFILTIAPLLTLYMYHGSKSYAKDVFISNKNSSGSLAESIMFLLFRKKNITGGGWDLPSGRVGRYFSSSTPNSNDPLRGLKRYQYYGIFITILLIILSNIFSFKSILFYYIIIVSIYLIYLLLDLYIFILYINNKITTPYYLPDYIRKWFLNKEEIAKANKNVIRLFVDLSLREILVYIVVLSFIIITYKFIL